MRHHNGGPDKGGTFYKNGSPFPLSESLQAHRGCVDRPIGQLYKDDAKDNLLIMCIDYHAERAHITYGSEGVNGTRWRVCYERRNMEVIDSGEAKGWVKRTFAQIKECTW